MTRAQVYTTNQKCVRFITRLFLIGFLCSSFISCNRGNTFFALFPNDAIVLERQTKDFETFGNVEDIYCNDSILIAYNSGLDNLFTMYDVKTGQPVSPLGRIGHGHNEIPIGCVGGIYDNRLIVFKDVNKIIATFNLSASIRKLTADTVVSYTLDETVLSCIAPVDSNRYLGMGTYKWEMHYVLFDAEGKIYDNAVPIYNAKDNRFNMFTKFLSNQGTIIKHPTDFKYVGATVQSGIIDFLQVKDNHIYHLKGYDNIPPTWDLVQEENMNALLWTDKTINGFLDISGNEQYVFALYSEYTMNQRAYVANNILVFDWEGNPKHLIKLDTFCQQIAANNTALYTLSEDKEGNHHIIAYSLDILE